jgi:hypothetical protein
MTTTHVNAITLRVPGNHNIEPIPLDRLDLDKARQYVLENLDTTKAWALFYEGRIQVYLLKTTVYRVDDSTGKVEPTELKYIPDFNQHTKHFFKSEEDALADYKKHEAVAKLKLGAAEKALNELQEKFNALIYFNLEGDTHGIYNEYMYIEVTEGNYTFKKILGD